MMGGYLKGSIVKHEIDRLKSVTTVYDHDILVSLQAKAELLRDLGVISEVEYAELFVRIDAAYERTMLMLRNAREVE